MRESVDAKAHRYLGEGRLTLTHLTADVIEALCRGLLPVRMEPRRRVALRLRRTRPLRPPRRPPVRHDRVPPIPNDTPLSHPPPSGPASHDAPDRLLNHA